MFSFSLIYGLIKSNKQTITPSHIFRTFNVSNHNIHILEYLYYQDNWIFVPRLPQTIYIPFGPYLIKSGQRRRIYFP